MSPYIQKSNDNLTAAECLLGTVFYEASAHSAYYSIFFIIKELLNSKFGIGHQEQINLFNGAKSHQKFFVKFAECINNTPDFEANDYLVWFNQINKLRNQLDYKPGRFKKKIFEENVSNACTFIEGINNKFKLY